MANGAPNGSRTPSGGNRPPPKVIFRPESGAPKADPGTNGAPKWVLKSRKCNGKKHLKIDAEKVLKIMVKWHGNCGQMHGKIDKFTELFGRGTNAKKH